MIRRTSLFASPHIRSDAPPAPAPSSGPTSELGARARATSGRRGGGDEYGGAADGASTPAASKAAELSGEPESLVFGEPRSISASDERRGASPSWASVLQRAGSGLFGFEPKMLSSLRNNAPFLGSLPLPARGHVADIAGTASLPSPSSSFSSGSAPPMSEVRFPVRRNDSATCSSAALGSGIWSREVTRATPRAARSAAARRRTNRR